MRISEPDTVFVSVNCRNLPTAASYIRFESYAKMPEINEIGKNLTCLLPINIILFNLSYICKLWFTYDVLTVTKIES